MPTTYRSPRQPSRREVRKEYDRHRGSARERGYTHDWDKASKRNLIMYPLCVGCLSVDRTQAATVTDHIIPHKGDMDLFWDGNNWQSCCTDHHNIIKAILENEYADGKISEEQLKLDSDRAIELTNLRM